MAKYPYIVVKNNIWYSAGAEVPVYMPNVEKEEVPVDMPAESKKTTRGRKKQV